MSHSDITRRSLLKTGSSALAGLSVLRLTGPAAAFQTPAGGEVIPWLDQPAENPVPQVAVRQLAWEELDSWITSNEDFFIIKHYDEPVIDESTWSLTISGHVSTPLTLTLDDIRNRPSQDVTFTIECSGNSGLPFLTGAVGNATWTGTPLAPLLEEAGVLDTGSEVIFWGADAGEQLWRDEITVTEHFARSMSLQEALAPENLLAYEMNGEPLPPLHGFPLRLIAPGWYGVANVKWLTGIEVIDHRYQGHFMARDYVTIRESEQDGETTWMFTSVSHARIKSAPAKVMKQDDQYSIMGAAWGAEIASVDVSIDSGDWQPATLTETGDNAWSWVFWNFNWEAATPGEHTVTSRATGTAGNVQPAPGDPILAGKKTYWESNGEITRTVVIP